MIEVSKRNFSSLRTSKALSAFGAGMFDIRKISNFEYLMYYYDKNPKLTLLLLDQNMRKLLLVELKRRVGVLS